MSHADELKQSSFQDHKYHLVDTPERFDKFLQELAGQRRIAFDLETTSLSPRQAEIVGYAFSWKEGEAWYLPVRGLKRRTT